MLLSDWPEDFQPDLAYVRDLMNWLNDCVIESLVADRMDQAQAWLAVMESIRQHLDLYCRSLQR